jgi:hypothetical protein
MDAAWLTAFTALAVAVAGCLLWAARHTWRVIGRVIHFLDDYSGQPSRDGLPARPGLMARLATLEESVQRLATEMEPNHGTSLRDVVHRTAGDVADIKQEQALMRARIELFETQRAGRERKNWWLTSLSPGERGSRRSGCSS